MIEFDAQAMSHLSISVYLPRGSGHATTHRVALKTGYLSGAGDFTAAASLPADAGPIC